MADVQRAEEVLKAIADGTRLRILGLVAESPRSGAELARELGLTAPTVSHHMSRLVGVGLVQVEREGARHLYRLNDAVLQELGGRGPAAPGPAMADDPEHERHLRIFFDGARLRQIPAKRKARVSVLLHLLRGFEPGRDYSEAEVNTILREAHDDVATLRRELVDYRYLTRVGGVYSVVEAPPERDANEAQEVPAGEAAWIGALLRETRRDS